MRIISVRDVSKDALAPFAALIEASGAPIEPTELG